MWDSLKKCAIIGIAKERIYNMLVLFLLVVEKLVNDPKPLLCLLGISVIITVYLNKRTSYIHQKVYVDKELSNLMRSQLRGIIGMFLPMTIMTELMRIVTCASDKKIFVFYYTPMLILVIFQRIHAICKSREENYIKCGLYVLPGLSSHVLFITLLLCADKGIWGIAAICMCGVIVPTGLEIGILSALSPRDIKMVEITMNNGDVYNIEYRDLKKRNGEVSIRVRDKYKKIKQVIIVKKEDIAKQTVYIAPYKNKTSK